MCAVSMLVGAPRNCIRFVCRYGSHEDVLDSVYVPILPYCCTRYFQHAHFIPIVGVGNRGEYYLVHDDLPRQHSFGTTLRFTGPMPADSRQ